MFRQSDSTRTRCQLFSWRVDCSCPVSVRSQHWCSLKRCVCLDRTDSEFLLLPQSSSHCSSRQRQWHMQHLLCSLPGPCLTNEVFSVVVLGGQRSTGPRRNLLFH